MKFSLIATATACVVLVGALLVAAGGYGHGPYAGRGGYGNYRPHAYGLQHGAGNVNNGYGHNQAGRYSAYGPYHSYAVRPAIYGGHGLYHYRGYARYPAPPAHHYGPRNYAPACHGYRCGAPKAHYGLRPVKALVLAPAYHGSTYTGSSYGGHGRSVRYQDAADHRQNNHASSGYGATRQAYGSAHPSANYGPAYPAADYSRQAYQPAGY